jgi:hypothetical protein
MMSNVQIKYAKGAKPDKRSYRVDFSKIAQTVRKFKPQWNARLGAKQLYYACKKSWVILEECKGPRYRRITYLENSVSTGRLNRNLRRKDAYK